MHRQSFLLSALLTVLAFCTFAAAPSTAAPQIGQEPSGSYELRRADGSPIQDGLEVGADIARVGPGVWTITPWVRDDQGYKVPIPGEEGTLTRVGDEWENMWLYRNARGNLGSFVWNSENERYETEMITGDNAGTKRILVPIERDTIG